MAGRGRRGGGGRGRGLSFNVESLGFTHGEALPPPTLQPPPYFPPLEFKAVPLIENEEQGYLLALKQELRGTLRESAFFVHPVTTKKDVERYSDKYQQNVSSGKNFQCNWKQFPRELWFIRKRVTPGQNKSAIAAKKIKPDVDIKKKLEELEEGEKKVESDEEPQEGEKEEEEGGEGEVEEEDLYDEEEQEEGTDYISSYFDNGENYLDDDDDNLDDGPVY